MKKRNQIARTEGLRVHMTWLGENNTGRRHSVYFCLSSSVGRSLWVSVLKLVKMFSKSCAILLLSAAACSALNTEDVSLYEDQSDPRVFFANYTSSKSRGQVLACKSEGGNRKRSYEIFKYYLFKNSNMVEKKTCNDRFVSFHHIVVLLYQNFSIWRRNFIREL